MRKRRWTRRHKIVLALVVFFAGGPLIGCIYEQYAVRRDAKRFPPPGEIVDVGGHRLHLVCIGSGSPVVVVEPSGFSNSMSFAAARTEVARRTRVCSYDRMGIGWSDPGPSAISAGMLADDLRRLTDAAHLRSPVILVSASIGGLTAELFARRYPDRVAGLVFLDAANSELLIARVSDRAAHPLARAGCGAVRAAGAVGLVRLLDPWHLRDDARAARSAALMYGAKPWVMLCAMVRGVDVTIREFGDAAPLRRELPVTALSAETRDALVPPAIAAWIQPGGGALVALRASHQRLARGSVRGVWRIVPGSDHLIASSQPQAVVDEVLDMVRLKADTTPVSASARRAGR